MIAMLSVSLAYMAHPNLQCASLQDIALDTSTFLEKFPSTGDPNACCQLCGGNQNCTAFTISKDSTCFILTGVAHPAPVTGAFSGYTPAARTHNRE